MHIHHTMHISILDGTHCSAFYHITNSSVLDHTMRISMLDTTSDQTSMIPSTGLCSCDVESEPPMARARGLDLLLVSISRACVDISVYR